MNPKTEPATLSAGKKPRLAILLATGFGLGYLPKAPGTWGSLGGLALVWCLCQFIPDSFVFDSPAWTRREFLELLIVVAPLLAILGVWAAGRAARYLAAKDPQIVVIDEISGQLITFFGGPPVGHIFFGFSLAQVARVPRWHAGELEIFAAGLYTFSCFSYLEAVPGAAGGSFARRLGHHG